ncbi:microfibril-associated glycoprotein 4-like [Clavelina lepadiformis]|uniref:Fibrinogen C-terminal domain-containing protein n=1 Tax=Clavelina lepadiformis TaxID=159417 RepID=A0ABP0GUT4_CLALP
MKLAATIPLCVCLVQIASTQQCRQITVCDDEDTGGGRRRGEKGEIGAPGKSGTPGSKGSKGDKGDVGPRGIQGDSCALGSFETTIWEKLAEIEEGHLPSSCFASSVYGRQLLRTGEEAFCDGGWTVFQRRFDGSVSFDRNWDDYVAGFGSLDGEFWLGLDKIHNLTNGRGCRLRIDIWDFENDHAFAEYSSFSMEDESDNYRLHIGGYGGNAGNSMTYNNNMRFSTKDSDNDVWSPGNCAVDNNGPNGGWWWQRCGHARLNSVWGSDGNAGQNIGWYDWKDNWSAMKTTSMKFRCN